MADQQTTDTRRIEAQVFVFRNAKHGTWAWGRKGGRSTLGAGFSTRAEAMADGVQTLSRWETEDANAR